MHILRVLGVAGATTALLLSATTALAHDHDPISLSGPGESGKVRSALARPMLASTTATTTRRVEIMEKERERLQDIREEAKQRVEIVREEAKERVEAAREEAKERSEVVRETAKQRLEDIKDRTKQQMALRIANQFDHINSAWTDHFAEVLDRYDVILGKIQTRANAAATSTGADITAVTTAIANAQSAIKTARDAVAAQAAKVYTVDPPAMTVPTTATTTSNGEGEFINALRSAFKNQHNALFTSLFALRDGPMKNARQAVHAALEALKQVPGVGGGNATSTAPVSGN